MQNIKALELIESHNYAHSYYEAAKLLDEKIKEGYAKHNNLTIPRNYMYALVFEMILKEVLFNYGCFTAKDQYHNMKNLLDKAINLLSTIPELLVHIEKIKRESVLLEKMSKIILYTARYYYPKCPDQQKQYSDHIDECRTNIICSEWYNEPNSGYEFIDADSPILSNRQLDIIRDFIECYYLYRKDHSIDAVIDKMFSVRDIK